MVQHLYRVVAPAQCNVHHGIAALQCLAHHVELQDIALDHSDILHGQVTRNTLRSTGKQNDLMAGLQQCLCNILADIAGAAGNKNFHKYTILSKSIQL